MGGGAFVSEENHQTTPNNGATINVSKTLRPSSERVSSVLALGLVGTACVTPNQAVH